MAKTLRIVRQSCVVACCTAVFLVGAMGCASGTAWQNTALEREKEVMETAIANTKAIADIALKANSQALFENLPRLYRDFERYTLRNPNATHEDILKYVRTAAAVAVNNVAQRLLIAGELRAKRDIAIANLEDGLAINRQAREVNRAQMIMRERIDAALKASADAVAEHLKARETAEAEEAARRKNEWNKLKSEALRALGVNGNVTTGSPATGDTGSAGSGT